MNVFEDLIVELKEENLLENTVVEADKEIGTNGTTSSIDSGSRFEIEILGEPSENSLGATQIKARPAKEFFNKRAVEEVSNLQMVEHVLTGVEREYMQIVPKTYNDLQAKKALHIFVNLAETADSEEHKSAEFALSGEIEAWGMALLERDHNVPVSLLRQYCENSRPALSSQAILALARFYRNAPYSESVRAKFDFIITRLFSRTIEQDKRACVFGRNEMLTHLNTLYAEWSSIPIYTADEDDSKVMLTGLSFDDLAIEAENIATFDQLIESDFFGRLRHFKESTNELFYEPSVTVSAVESNVRIGNAYVNLIVNERRKMDAAAIQLKYIEFSDQLGSVSDAAGRTLELAEVLNILTDDVIKGQSAAAAVEAKSAAAETKTFEPEPTPDTVRSPWATNLIAHVKGVNKALVGICFALLLLSGGLYVWSTYLVEAEVSSAGVIKVNLEGSPLNEHIKTGRISGETFYGLLNSSWDNLPKEKREEFLQKVLQAGAEKGYNQVSLITKEGKSAGFATATKAEVNMP
jgi:hypothetical protein